MKKCASVVMAFFLWKYSRYLIFFQLLTAVISITKSLSFDCHEDHSYAGIPSPDYAIPPSSNSTENEKIIGGINFAKYYEEGKQLCINTLKNPSQLKPIKKQFLAKYGVVFLAFGPTSTCYLSSKCWYGMISCGQFKLNLFLQEYQQEIKRHRPRGIHMEPSPYLPNRPIPKFLGWSLQSLHHQFRIVGPEILFPEVVYVQSHRILFCSYTLTLPGSYRIEIIPTRILPRNPLQLHEERDGGRVPFARIQTSSHLNRT